VGLFPANVKGGTWNRTAGARHFNNDGEPTDYQTSGSDGTTGSAARFFYCAKASKADRDEGCEGLPVVDCGTYAQDDWTRNNMGGFAQQRRNHHPTVKPTALMRYLCRLVTPPGGIVLDPFTGSGSTGKAAVLEGFEFIGIEREAEYVEIAKARIASAADAVPPLFRKPK
jgi:DNA modification methylase